MPRVDVFLVLVACLQLCATRFAAVHSVLDKNTVEILAKNADDGCVNVLLFRKIRYAILWDSRKNPADETDATYAFYTTLTCMVSEWASNGIQAFVQKFPLFYQREFADTARAREYANNFDAFADSARSMDAIVRRSLDALYGVLVGVPGARYSNDTSIVKTLLSLHVKLSLTSLQREKAVPEFVASDAALVREMLEEMNAIQGYIAMHCECGTRAVERQPKLHGYFAASDPDTMADTVSEALRYARSNLPFGVDSSSDGGSCTVDQTFLYDVVSIATTTDDFSEDVAGSSVRINGNGTATIRELHDVYRRTHDLRLLYVYNESVMAAILKTLYTLVLTALYDRRELSSSVKRTIAEIRSEMSGRGNDFPEDVVDGFEQLTTIASVRTARGRPNYFDLQDVRERTAVLKLYDFCTSADVAIKFPIPFVIGRAATGRIVVGDRWRTGALRAEETDEAEEAKKNSEYLETILTKIREHVDDFACFHRHLKRARIHYYDDGGGGRQLQRVPAAFVRRTGKIQNTTVATTTHCDFISEMFLNYYRTVVFVNRAEEKNPDEQPAYFSRARRSMRSMRSHFLAVVGSDTRDPDLLAVARNVVAILVNQKISEIAVADVRLLKKVMNVIMVELNGYALQNCGLPEFNFLLVNNLNVRINSFQRTRGVGYSENNGADSNTAEPSQTELCFNVEHLHSKFNENSKTFKEYNDVVHVYWKGKAQSLVEIFADVTFMFLNPRDLYSLYHVYFNFFIAVVYIELTSYSLIRKSGPTDLLSPVDFPREYKRLISDVNELWALMKRNNKATATLEIRIEQQFKNVIVIKRDEKTVSGRGPVKVFDTFFYYKRAAKISSMVNDVSQCYCTITNLNGNKRPKTVGFDLKRKKKIFK